MTLANEDKVKQMGNDDATDKTAAAKQGLRLVIEGLTLIGQQLLDDLEEDTPAAVEKSEKDPKNKKSEKDPKKPGKRETKKEKLKREAEEHDNRPDDDDDDDDDGPNMNDCRNAMLAVIKSHGTKAAKGVLKKFDVGKAADLEDDQFEDFIEACEAME